MDWKYNPHTLLQLLNTLSRGSSPDNAVQQQVTNEIQQFHQMFGPDFNAYLVFVFGELGPERPEVAELRLTPPQLEGLRQQAGLLLKHNIRTAEREIPPSVMMYVKQAILKAVQIPSKPLRNTAGSLITTVISKYGLSSWLEALEVLCSSLDCGQLDIVDGSFSALSKICEDGLEFLRPFCLTDEQALQGAKPFADFVVSKLLPKLVAFVQPPHSEVYRLYSITCFNHFVLNNIFQQSSPLFPQAAGILLQYKSMLGVLAKDTCYQVIQQVCQGFCHMVEHHADQLGADLEMVAEFMLTASQHPEYDVRLGALEFWPAFAQTGHHSSIEIIDRLVPRLVPVLLKNMVYSDMDYAAMDASMIDDDNAAKPDLPEDIKPRFHDARNAKDEEDEGGAWGADWTVRKAAANALDNISAIIPDSVLPVILPLIERDFNDPNWEVQESSVLAVGAIGHGCMRGLTPHLKAVLQMLLQKCEAPKPLLRSIACWSMSRFSEWIIHGESQSMVLGHVVKRLLVCILDRNKRVQEAACSAFATLEESAGAYLVPYLPEIVPVLVQAFQYYQAKNLLNLYDALGTLAESVGSALRSDEYAKAILPSMWAKFEQTPDNDRSLITLFECLASIVAALGDAIQPVAKAIVERCCRIISTSMANLEHAKATMNYDMDKCDREIMSCSIDLLAAMIDGYKTNIAVILKDLNFFPVIKLVVKDTAVQVKQSGFAMMGDAAKYGIQYLLPELPELLPLCTEHLTHMAPAVANNASWAVGEVCMQVSAEQMAPYIEQIILQLVKLLKAPNPSRMQLLQNAAITLGRLAIHNPAPVAKVLPQFIEPWCLAIREMRLDHEKVNACTGFVAMLKMNPDAGVVNGPSTLQCIMEVILSCSYNAPIPALAPQFKEVFQLYRTKLGGDWDTFWNALPPVARERLTQYL